MFTKRMQRIGSLLVALALTTLLWGCGTAPTGVDMQETLQPAGQDVPTSANTENDTNSWW